MRTVSDWWLARNKTGATPRLIAESWLGADYLGTVPVVPGSWRFEDDSEQQIPGAVSLQVPNQPEWRPAHPTDPLADYGQVLRCAVGWEHTDGTIETQPAGVFRITSAQPAGSSITVSGVGLLAAVDEARFLYPFSTDATTRAGLTSRLLQGLLPVIIEVPDRPAAACSEDQDRLSLLRDVVDSWPARLWIDSSGIARVSPAWDDDAPGAPVAGLSEGDTIIRNGVTIDPGEPGPNAYRVSNIPEGDVEAVWAVATISEGPMRYGGPYGYRVNYYSSPLLSADPAALAEVARTMCARAARRTLALTVRSTPRWEIEVGDVVTVDAPSVGVAALGRVVRAAHTSISSEFKIARLKDLT